MPRMFFFALIGFWIIMSCEPETSVPESSIDRIVVHINKEPQRLNPIFTESSEERIVTEHMFLSLCDYDPVSGRLAPVLIKTLPTTERSVNEQGETIVKITAEILPDAIWANNSPITGHDVAFTLKMANLPSVSTPMWKNLQNDVIDIDVSESNHKIFSITFSGDYFLSQDGVLTAEILPRHKYDPEGILKEYTYSSLKTDEEAINVDSTLASLGKMFSSAQYSRDTIIEGAAAYRLDKWQSGQFIVLNKVDNWWGDNYPERTLLHAYPDQIVYQIVTDPTVAITQLKGGQLDVLSLSGSATQAYMDLQEDPSIAGDNIFLTPELTRIYYILLNNQDVRLSDVRVRRALAHLMDVQRLINQQELGLGTVVNSAIHPNQMGYYDGLNMVTYNVDQAIALLKESGWIDQDGDGIREKIIGNVNEELNLRFFISGSSLSTSISTLLKESALKAGINIELVTKSGRASRQENIIPGNYELTAQAMTSEGRKDPYSMFHTDAMGANGQNWSGYSNAIVDDLIETIRFTTDEAKRMQAYEDFQKIIEKDQPLIFLYAPVEKLVIANKFDPLISSKRPGFFVNSFRRASGS